MTQIDHDARFTYVYAWGLKDLNDQISFYEKTGKRGTLISRQGRILYSSGKL
jgi:hypothetical protein